MSVKTGKKDIDRKIKLLEEKIVRYEWENRALKEKFDIFQNMLESSSQGIIVYRNLKPLYLNPAFAGIFGYSTHEILSMATLLPLIGSHDHFRFSSLTCPRLKGMKLPIRNEFDGLKKNASPIRLSCDIMIVDWEGEPAVKLSVIDITQANASDHPPPANTTEQADLLEKLPIAFCRIDPQGEGKFLKANSAFIEMLGYSSLETVQQMNESEVYYNYGDRKEILSQLKDYGLVTDYSVLLRMNDESPIWVLLHAFATISKKDKNIEYFDCIIEHTDDLREKQIEWERKEKEYRAIIQNASTGILIHKNLKPVFVNQACADIYGYLIDEILALESILKIIAPNEHDRIVHYNDARRRGQNAPIQYECQGMHKDGDNLWIENWVTQIEWDGEPAIMKIQVDITYRKRSEKTSKRTSAESSDAPGGFSRIDNPAENDPNSAESPDKESTVFLDLS